MSTFEATLEQLPKPILNKLQSIIWRVRRLLFIRGLFTTFAIGLFCLLAIMAVDASVTIFSSTVRWGMSLAGLAITVFSGWWFLLLPLSRKLSLTHVARILEVRHPELQERISTAVELLSSDDPEEIKGSEELIQTVVDSAVLDVKNINPRREFKGGKTARFVKLASLGLIGLLVAVLYVFPNHGWKLLTRAVAPFSNIGNAYADTMVVEPGDIRISKGKELNITMTVKHDKLRRAELRRLLEDGSDSVERMTLMGKTEDGAQKFSITFPNVQESFSYRVRAGVGLSKYFEVEAVSPPVIEERTISYDFPEYTQLESIEQVDGSGEIKAVANTKITIASVVNKEVYNAKTILNDAGELGNTTVEDNIVTTNFTLKNAVSGTWRLDIQDMDQFENDRMPFPIQALPDRPPVVRITNPTVRELRLKPVEVLPLNFEIGEDFGFSEVAILVTPNDETNPRVIVQPTPAPAGNRIWRGEGSLNLASLDLKDNQNRLQVQIRALDNRPESYNGPGEGISDTITIIIDRNAKSLAEQTIDGQKKELTKAIRDARNDLERAKNDMKNAERELGRKDEITQNAERVLDRFRDEAKEAEETLKEVAEKLQNSVFNKQVDALEDIAKDEIAKAQEAADLIPVTDDKKKRVAEAREARKQVEKAIEDLKGIEQSLRETEEDLRDIAELNEMANEQRELAQDAAQQAQNQGDERQQQQAMKEFQKRQERVQHDLGEMLKDNAAALEEVLAKQQKDATDLAEQAKHLAGNQERLKEILTESTKVRPDQKQTKKLEEAMLEFLLESQKHVAEQAKAIQQQEGGQPDSELGEKGANTDKSAAVSKEEISNSTQPDEEKKANNQVSQSPEDKRQQALNQAVEEAENTVDALSQNEVSKATENAAKAENSLFEAAELAPADKQFELGFLAGLQGGIADQLKAIEEGNLQEALAQMEKQLAEDSGDLQTQAESLKDTLENLQQRQSRSEAQQASNQLKNAERQADSATTDLEQAQQAQDRAESQNQVPEGQFAQQTSQSMQRSRQDQEQAQRSMESAARNFEKSSKAIGQTMKGLKPSEDDERLADSEKMAESFEDITEATQSENAQQAAERSQQAAESLQQLAQQAMQKLGQMGQNPNGEGQQSQQQQQNQMSQQEAKGDQPNDGKKMPDANGDGIPPELAELGLSEKDWARFKGALSGGSATAIDTNLPAEYRELVGRYFQVIAKEADGK